jgi:transcriptional regulator with XRE-family HTH domain
MATLKVSDRVGELGTLAGDLGTYLREQRQSARLSLRQLASVAGVSNPYLSQIERGLRKPSADVLQQLAKGLQISAEALFLRAGFLEESDGMQVEVAIQSDLQLTARQKRVLLDIYATFRAENARVAGPEAEAPDEDGGDRTPGASRATRKRDAAEVDASEATTTRRAATKTAKKTAKTTKTTARRATGTRTATKRAARKATIEDRTQPDA